MSTPASPFRLVDVTLARRTSLSPALCRFTFTGPDLAHIRTNGPDQRIKIFFPNADGEPPALENTQEWYTTWRAMDPQTRPPMRTYTIRAFTAAPAVLDVDFVLHGDAGPASRWAEHAQPGDTLQIVAPNAAFDGEPGGYEWKPPAELEQVLLIADETALPAAAGILEELAARPTPPRTQLFLEVPTAEDRIDLPDWPGLQVEWMPRDRAAGSRPAAGALMIGAAHRARIPVTVAADTAALADIDVDVDRLWDLASTASDGFYGWVAGEAMAVRAIRQFLIKEQGVDRNALNLMGYWRKGQVLE